MALPTSGQISAGDVRTELGLSTAPFSYTGGGGAGSLAYSFSALSDSGCSSPINVPCNVTCYYNLYDDICGYYVGSSDTIYSGSSSQFGTTYLCGGIYVSYAYADWDTHSPLSCGSITSFVQV